MKIKSYKHIIYLGLGFAVTLAAYLWLVNSGQFYAFKLWSQDNVLTFVEVKLKRGDDFGTPEEMIGSSKLSRVTRMAEFYLTDKPEMTKKYDSFSIDAVCIVINEWGEVERINHYENIGF